MHSTIQVDDSASTPRRWFPRTRLSAIAGGALAAALVVGLGAAGPAHAETSDVDASSYEWEHTPINDQGYQVAYSEANNLIWTTSTGHEFDDDDVPYAASSTVTGVDADTGEIVTIITPRELPDPDRVEAAYGLGVDDSKNQVWTTSTRENSVVVYDQETGERVVTIPDIERGRDIQIDPYRGTAFISSTQTGNLYEIDTETYEVVTLDAEYLGLEEFSPISIDLHVTEETSLLYAVNANGGDLLELNHTELSNRVVASFDDETAGTGVAVDYERGLAYVASEESNTLRTVTIDDGDVVNTAIHTDGLVYVDVDEANGLVYATTSIHGEDVFVTDADTGEAVDALDIGAEPNDVHVANDKVWILDRGFWEDTDEGENARLWNLTPENA